MLAMAAGAAAHAGCAVVDDAAVRASAPLVAVGTVVSLGVLDDDVVEAVVRIDSARVGVVASGFLPLRTRLSGAGCPGDEVWPPGAVVSVVATPDTDGVVWPSPCAWDVARADVPLGDAGSRAVAGRWPGVLAVVLPAPSPFPTAGSRRARLVRAGRAVVGGVELDGGGSEFVAEAAVHREEAQIGLVVDDDAYTFSASVRPDDLDLVAVRPVAPQPGVRLLPGAPLRTTSPLHEHAGVVVEGVVGTADQGRVWTPSPAPDIEANALLAADTPLRQQPGGAVVALLRAGGAYALRTTGVQREGWAEVQVAAPYLRATGWVPASGLGGGLETRGYGSGWGRQGTWVRLGEGLSLASSDGAAVFARVRTSVDARLVAVDGAVGWFLVETPWGRIVGRATCAAPPSASTPCDPT